jgi:tetratricopeptide (TPR) repeat protein
VLAAAAEPTRERARALVATAALEVRRNRPRPVIGLATEALEIIRRGGDRRAEARATERLATIAMGIFDWAAADRALADALALATELGDAPVLVAVKQAMAVRQGGVGETERARELLDESLLMLGEIDDEGGPVFWAQHISPVVLPSGPGGVPRSFFEDTYCLFRAVGAGVGTGYVLCNIGETLRADGELAGARQAFERSLEQFRRLGDEQGMGVALNALGNLARATGEVAVGRACFEEALALRRAVKDAREIAMTLMGMGMLALQTGDDDEGRRLIDEAYAIYVRIDDGPGLMGVPLNLANFALDGGDPRRAVELYGRSIALWREQGLARHRGWASTGVAEAAIAIGEPERVRPAVEDALALFDASGDRRGTRHALALLERAGLAAEADLSG